MQDASHRRITLFDMIVLIAATAVGFALARAEMTSSSKSMTCSPTHRINGRTQPCRGYSLPIGSQASSIVFRGSRPTATVEAIGSRASTESENTIAFTSELDENLNLLIE